jgi:hypothetical protein
MNGIAVVEILNWFLLAVFLTCIITLACALNEHYTNRKRRRQSLVRMPVSNQAAPQLAAKKLIVRGYDTPELLREDLWLLRLSCGRDNITALKMAVPPFETALEAGRSQEQRVTAMLAQYAGARCDN